MGMLEGVDVDESAEEEPEEAHQIPDENKQGIKECLGVEVSIATSFTNLGKNHGNQSLKEKTSL